MTDTQFITNQQGHTLKERFQELIKDTELFDVLVGYFYISGFHQVYKALETTKKVRILIGIGMGGKAFELVREAGETQLEIFPSHSEIKEHASRLVQAEMADSPDEKEVEDGARTFVRWLKNKKIEIRAYPSQKVHAKLYIMTFKEEDRDKGRVITGSSNFTESGLMDNLEFNIELKNADDYDFASRKFNELWQDAVDVSDDFVQSLQKNTWLSDKISPYYLYLKFLYEYFKDDLNLTDDMMFPKLPPGFKDLEYQRQAVLNAKKTLDSYGGVFLSDVVGLGKTYIAAMLASQLNGHTLVIAPPILLDMSNPGSWTNVFDEFGVPARFVSHGMLDTTLDLPEGSYQNVIIDEAHRFRNEATQSYDKLARICRGKRVILVTATPYNNTPTDILNMIELFQSAHNSTIPGLPDIEAFFKDLAKKLQHLDRQKDYSTYMKIVQSNAKQIREKVLKHLMIRRTRREIETYFKNDLKQAGVSFPKVEKPVPLYYQLNFQENSVFNKTIKMISQDLVYSRYTPLLYAKQGLSQFQVQSQKNMGVFMKILLVKRLESSFYAFRMSLSRFIASYEHFIDEIKKGDVYVSKQINKIFELIALGDMQAVQALVDMDKAQRYDAGDFKPELLADLHKDLGLLKEISQLWDGIKRDPKLIAFKDRLQSDRVLKKNHVIIFTESSETAEYLQSEIRKFLKKRSVLVFTGQSNDATRRIVIQNFDANAHKRSNDYRILIATEVLAEGVNLHRANVVINYDIPWNPTRMMQRIGRINRVDTTHKRLYTYNFFPTAQSNKAIKLEEAAKAKLNAFFTLLGGDAYVLTDGEPIGSHKLFSVLTSTELFDNAEKSETCELKYLQQIKAVREKKPDLFEKIKHLPKKARSAKILNPRDLDRDCLAGARSYSGLITYFRKGSIQKFFFVEPAQNTLTTELDFSHTAALLESRARDRRIPLPQPFYDMLKKNKTAFDNATNPELADLRQRAGRGSGNIPRILKIMRLARKLSRVLTDDQEDYLETVIHQVENNGLPKQTAKHVLADLQKLGDGVQNPLKVLAILQKDIDDSLLRNYAADRTADLTKKREVILSMYMQEDENE